jgi:hypothetical protein
MILVLGNFAGVFSNLCKLLTWSLILKDSDSILFYYTNKGNENDNVRVLPFQNYGEDTKRIFFYKYFEYPEGCSLESFYERDRFEMGYPSISNEALPSFLQKYPGGFFFCNPKLYLDPDFPAIRHLYNAHLQKRLRFTESMKAYIEKDLSVIRGVQQQGKKVLAVFLRSTCHFRNYNVDAVFSELRYVMKDYDYIYPVTQIGAFLQRCIQEFGNKTLVFERRYLNQDVDWTRPMSDEDFELEFRDAIADVYMASQCDFIMGGSSNMFLGALFFNSQIPFQLFAELADKEGL